MRGALFGVTMLALSLCGFAADWQVPGPGASPTIQEAIDAALDGDRVVVAPGQYTTDVPITFLRKKITVVAEAGPEVTTIRMADSPADPDRASVVIFENGEDHDSVLEGFTLTNGQGTFVPECPCSYGGAVFCKGASPLLTGCIFTGNRSWLGGGVGLYESNAILTGCTVEGNSARKGAGIQASFSTSVILEDCTIAGNEAEVHGGGLRSYSCSVTVTGCTIEGNTAGNYGGGTIAEMESTEALTDCTISGNSARVGGGVYSWGSCSSTLTTCTIQGNVATYGGALCRGEGTAGFARLEECVLSGNSAISGGAVYCYPSSLTLNHCTVVGNAAGAHGGGIFCHTGASPIVESCIVWHNSGGSIRLWDNTASVIASDCCIEGDGPWLQDPTNCNDDPHFGAWGNITEVWVDGSNPGPGNGTPANPFPDIPSAVAGYDLALAPNSPCLAIGANAGLCGAAGSTTRLVHVAPGTYDLGDAPFCCRVSLEGAGADRTVLRGSVLGLRTDARLSDVTVTGGTRGGICVGNWEAPIIENCIVTRNAGYYTGGISCWDYSSPTISDCTFAYNEADRGGGIRCRRSSPQFTNCVIVKNTALLGGAVYCIAASPTLICCTISGNTATQASGGFDCDGGSTPQLTNCIVWGNNPPSICGQESCCLTDQDPLFVDPLGGDFRLQAGSPAIDACPCVGMPNHDRDGNPRPAGKACDIGAYEYSPRFRRGDANADNNLDIADAICVLSYLFGPAGDPCKVQVPRCRDAADANDDGAVDISDGVFILQYLFASGPAIPPPYPACGVDPTVDDLECLEFHPCQ